MGYYTCVILLLNLAVNVFAVAEDQQLMYMETQLDSGIVMIDEVLVWDAGRSMDKTATRTRTFKDGDTVIAVISVLGCFHYDGETVSVVSKSVTQTDVYENWKYTQKGFTSSNGTITLNAELTKYIIFNMSFTMTLSCDKDGNITYT